MSNEYSIKVENVAKMYKMYKSNFAKISDLLGLPFNKDYEEFWPLKDINITIKKGEKVGIIGRNGAGKTTLLSMIADNIQPTIGKISVVGQVNALFVLGTGFHPEFSGRENIYSSLAFQGIVGNEAKRLEADIVEFAELEQFIDQPVKTYSAGMYARLAFTVATAVKPEILIIDEILGAGDAYFAAKAVERMKELTSGGSTVLFVSHDLASVQQMCERCIWIDKGKIREDGATLNVIKAYSADVRKREELRLLKKNSTKKDELNTERQLVFRFIGEGDTAPKVGLPIHKIKLLVKNEPYAEILLGDSMDNNNQENAFLITDKKTINWSEPKKEDDKWYREFVDLGRTNVHAAGIFILPKDLDFDKLDFEVEYKDSCDKTVNFEIYNEEKFQYIRLFTLKPNASNQWLTTGSLKSQEEFDLNYSITESSCSKYNIAETTSSVLKDNDVYGTSEIEISDFKMINSKNNESYVYTVNDELIFKIYFHVNKPVSKAVFVIAVYGADGKVVTQLISKEKKLIISDIKEDGVVNFHISELKIGAGEYIISLGIFHDINLINPLEQESYSLHDRKYKFKVLQPLEVNMNLGLLYQDCKVQYERI